MQPLDKLGGELSKATSNVIELQNKIAEQTATLQKELKKWQDYDKDVRLAIQQAMEDNGILKWENDLLAITYVKPSQRVGIDMDALRAQHPDIARDLQKITNVKASIRIKVKE